MIIRLGGRMNIRAGIGSLKLYRYMVKTGVKPELFHRFQSILETGMDLSEIEYFIEHAERDLGCYREDEKIFKRMERIFAFCGSNLVAVTVFELALLEYMDSSLDELLEILFPGHKQGIRLLEAVKILYPKEEYFDHIAEIVPCKKILPLFLLRDHENIEDLFCHYRADTRLIAFLKGIEDQSVFLKGSVKEIQKETELEPIFIHKEIADSITDFVGQNFENGSIVLIRGERNSGKRFLIQHCTKRVSRDLLLVDFWSFMEGTESELQLKKEALIREMMLSQAMLCISCISKQNEVFYNRLIGLLQEILFVFEEFKRTDSIFLTSEEKISLGFVFEQPILDLTVEKCSYSDNLKVWDGFVRLYLPSPLFCTLELADKLPLPVGVIQKVVKKISFMPQQYTDVSNVVRLCYSFLETEEVSSMKKIVTPYTMDTIKIEASSKRILQDICNQIRNRMQVFDTWKMRQMYPYGRCVSVLFTGPPGTGKTMAASVIANTVNLELYRVDLSQLVDKYIGETEKKLEHIFLQAERSHCILFFDEADSIFGKRSEVSDAKDRFANTQVAYLLQRIEEYDGIVILASNYRENIDKAFIRRISYIIEFVNPDAKIRYEIWRSLFIEPMEYEEIDFEFLARKFELSGAMIKNIVLKAAFFAASAKEAITMQWVLTALIQEYSKLGKKIQKEELEEYAFCIEE